MTCAVRHRLGGTWPENFIAPPWVPVDWAIRAIPILFGIDAVHGHAKLVGATIFPHNVGLGAAHDPDLIYRIGQATAAEVSATGIDWTFAPTVASHATCAGADPTRAIPNRQHW